MALHLKGKAQSLEVEILSLEPNWWQLGLVKLIGRFILAPVSHSLILPVKSKYYSIIAVGEVGSALEQVMALTSSGPQVDLYVFFDGTAASGVD